MAQTVLLDDFNRANNNAIGTSLLGTTWTETETVSPSSVQLNGNLVQMGSTTAGRDFMMTDVSSQYNTVLNTNTSTLVWQFNMQQTRTDPSGFDNSNYGIAFILGCSTGNALTGSGYAIVLGNSGSSDNLRLVRFNSGIISNAGISTIIGPLVYQTNQYLTVQVIYNPVGNNWSLYAQTNVGSFIDPTVATYTQLGSTTTDATFTGIDLPFLGCYWNHATGSTDFGRFDNVRIPSACVLATQPGINPTFVNVSSSTTTSLTLNWTLGSGSGTLIAARQGSAVSSVPADQGNYTASSIFGGGSTIGAGEFIVYMGSGTSVTVTGLTPGTTYYFAFFSYNGSLICTNNYLTPTTSTIAGTTDTCVPDPVPTVQSTNATASGIGASSMTVSWTRGNGSSCIVIANAVLPVSATPLNGSTYTANSGYGLGTMIAAGQYIVYIGTGNTVVVTGLAPSTLYYFSVFEFNGSGCNSTYLTSSPPSVSATTSAPVAYNQYRGNMHSHSDYSDGDADNVCNGAGSATCCYGIANTALNFDYMGISDHNHNEGPVMTPAKYASGLSEASAYSSSAFAALYGMEWGTISTGGHINVYGINQLIGWNTANYDVYCAKGDYTTLINLINSTSGAIGLLCHPNNTDFGNVYNLGYNLDFDNAIVGTAVKNGPAFSTNTTYTDPDVGNFVSYWNRLLSKGYHLGPLADMDNHNSATMGRSNQQRTVILAQNLSSSSVMDAMRNMRFYASEDYNTTVTFTVNTNYVMGSIITDVTDPVLNVTYADGDGETNPTIRIYYGIPGSNINPTVLTTATATSLNFTHTFASGTYYYYAEITQPDGQKIWTSPIWYTKQSLVLPIQLVEFKGINQRNGNLMSWQTATEIDNDFFTLERSRDGENFEPIVVIRGAGNSQQFRDYQYLDSKAEPGINYYRLKQTDYHGHISLSNIVAIESDEFNTPFLLYPNPARGFVNLSFNGHSEIPQEIRVYNQTGQLVYTMNPGDQQNRSLDLSFLPLGYYHIMVVYQFSHAVKGLILE